jgi:dihydrofolate reductase
MPANFPITAQMEPKMTKVKVAGYSVSLDGFGAGLGQNLDNPLGLHGGELFSWFFPTRTFRQMQGKEDGETGPDDNFARRAMAGFGAFILGRNMFGPSRGQWPDDQWKGWWGDNPPYHAPTFILTHYPRPPIEMLGGTTFHFVSDGIEAALRQARAAAGPKDVKIGGGVETVKQYVQAGCVDEIHLALSPTVLGQGEPLFSGLDLRALGYRTVEHVPTDRATHIVLAK